MKVLISFKLFWYVYWENIKIGTNWTDEMSFKVPTFSFLFWQMLCTESGKLNL